MVFERVCERVEIHFNETKFLSDFQIFGNCEIGVTKFAKFGHVPQFDGRIW